MPTIVTCAECGKRYRVHETGLTFPCKACGRELRVEEEPEPQVASGEHPCPHCEALVYARKQWGGSFELVCPKCGGKVKRPAWWMVAFLLGFFALGIVGAGSAQAVFFGSKDGGHAGAWLVLLLGFGAGALLNAGLFSLLLRAFPNYRKV